VLDFYPLWIVPYRAPWIYPWMPEEHRRRIGGEQLLIDCAIYGLRNADPEVDLSPLLDREVYELNGIKTLISSNHYDEQIFWKIYHRENYFKAKASLDPDNFFEDLYSKTHPHRSRGE